MTPTRLSRRNFLKISAVALGATALTYAGFNLMDDEVDTTPVVLNDSNYGEKSMSKKVLVVYASRTGSTAGVAEMIGKTLAECGAWVDVRQVEHVTDLSGYDAVVAGSAIQDQIWLPEAMQFLRDHQAELLKKPFASYMVCMTLSMANAAQYLEGVKEWMSPIRQLVSPVSEGYFAGGLYLSKWPRSFLRMVFRFVVLIGVWKEGDHRDWPAIQAWSRDLAPRLGL